ncbi:MAG: glycosyltransferase family 4 protein [Armatimonadota bacterium]|nr:glycosyltransferase family 4 protein [Armatimonadota bacterium]
MRILMLSWEYPPRIIGGVSRHVYEICDALAAKDVQIDVITCEHPEAPEKEEINGVNVYRVKAGESDGDFVKWVKHLNDLTEQKADELLAEHGKEPVLIHAHDWLAEYAAKSLKLKHKLPVVATIHATEYGRNYGIHTDLHRYINQVEWELAFEAWRVICCSHFMKEEIIRALGTSADKIDVIPNGVDWKKFEIDFDRKSFRRTFAGDDEKIIFFVGRMVNEKGAGVLIEAMSKISAAELPAKLLIVGGGDRTDLRQQAEDLGIADKVFFTGYIDDDTLLKIYNIADIAVFPSLYEPFGIVALEAMAAKVPVVTSDVGGLREVVDHGVTGITTWAGNPDSLAWGITQSLTNPGAAKSMAGTAYMKVRNVFAWPRIAERTLEVYRRVADEHSRSTWGVD